MLRPVIFEGTEASVDRYESVVGQTLVEVETKASYRLPPGPFTVNIMLRFRLPAAMTAVQTRISAMDMSGTHGYTETMA
jgi:hypothetical protein